jgi:molybdenum cofactor cytidylyltransferase
MDLWDALGVVPGSFIALIGAGGKTTTMLALAAGAQQRRLRALVTTTTKIWPPPFPLVLGSAADLDAALGDQFSRHVVVAAGASISPAGKLLGLPPEDLCSISAAEVVLCEADGAAGRPLKIHRVGEPVVPACTTHLVVLAGMDAPGQTVGASSHPSAESAAHFGMSEDDILDEGHIVTSLLDGARALPEGSALVFILNKVEDAQRREGAERIAGELQARVPGAAVLFASHGHPLAPPAQP